MCGVWFCFETFVRYQSMDAEWFFVRGIIQDENSCSSTTRLFRGLCTGSPSRASSRLDFFCTAFHPTPEESTETRILFLFLALPVITNLRRPLERHLWQPWILMHRCSQPSIFCLFESSRAGRNISLRETSISELNCAAIQPSVLSLNIVQFGGSNCCFFLMLGAQGNTLNF